jgi:hypothetical protein
MSKKRKVWVAVSLAVALVLLIPLGLRWKAQWQLSAYRKKLIAAGEKLTVEELAPRTDPWATNSALFLRLASRVQPFWQYQPTVMLPIKPGVSRVSWRQLQLLETEDPSKPATNIWPGLAAAMKTNEETLNELRSLVDAGGIEFIQDYSRAKLNDITYLIKVKQLVSDFMAGAMLALHQGQRQEALSYITSCGAISQLPARDPLMIDQLVRYACVSIAAGGCWEALQAGGWTDEQLAQLQHQWDQSDILAAAGSSLALERARAPMAFQAARASRQGMEDMLGGNSGLKNNAEIWNDFLLRASTGIKELITSYPRYYGWRWMWSYEDEERHLEFMQNAIEATRDTQKHHSILGFLKDRDEVSDLNSPVANKIDFLRLMTSDTKRFIGLALRAQTVANLVATAIALERFHLVHHTYPAELSELAPEYFPSVPVDPMDGHDIRYRLNPDGTYLLYSVGHDGVDDGGDPTPEKDKTKYFLNGRDWVWPRAAREEEVQAYEAEQSKKSEVKH